MGLPNLDYANPLYNFTSGNLTYTATKECYLAGTVNSSGQAIVNFTINDTIIFQSGSTGASWSSILKLNAGDVVKANVAAVSLHVFDVLS